jgi:hypothetical protein
MKKDDNNCTKSTSNVEGELDGNMVAGNNSISVPKSASEIRQESYRENRFILCKCNLIPFYLIRICLDL